MEFKFFTDLIDASGKVATGLKVLVQPPKAECWNFISLSLQ